MGQLALGLRSLLFKLVIFVVLASLLAWFLGGTLWPRPQRAAAQVVEFEGLEWSWQVLIGGTGPHSETPRWRLSVRANGRSTDLLDIDWADAAGFVIAGDALFTAAVRLEESQGWEILRLNSSGVEAAYPIPDRLAAEQQLARLAEGMEIQDVEAILRERGIVLDPMKGDGDAG